MLIIEYGLSICNILYILIVYVLIMSLGVWIIFILWIKNL